MPRRKRIKTKVDDYLSGKGLKRIRELAEQGATMDQIAADIGIARMTLFNWKARHPKIREALDCGEKKQEEVAIGGLFRLMQGYMDEEVRIERYRLNGKIIEDDPKFPIKEVVTRRFVPPNAGAIAFWLKCRRNWHEKAQLNMNVTPANPLQHLTTEELKRLANSTPEEGDVIDV